jgi:hypothetical protein
MKIVVPRVEIAVRQEAMAPRLAELRNARLGLWDSYVTRGADGSTQMYPLMAHLRDCLNALNQGISFLWDRRPNIARPAEVGLLEEFAGGVDGAIVGECASGSSVYATVHDAVQLERLGIPTLTICHHQLADAAGEHATQMGLPDLHFLIEQASEGGVVQSEKTLDCVTLAARVKTALTRTESGQSEA